MNTLHDIKTIIQDLPKAELHVHIEGTMAPELYMVLAKRNGIVHADEPLDSLRTTYEFSDFPSFITSYDAVTRVLQQEQDFYDLMLSYLAKAAQQGVVHAEIFFDIQTYLPRGIAPATIVHGLHQAICDGKQMHGISAALIMCIIRSFDENSALKALKLIEPFRDKVIGIGLAGLEHGNPPIKFKRVFERARAQGYHCVAHVEEGGPESIRQAIDILQVERIDHGFNIIHDKKLMQNVKDRGIAFTVCPASNIALGFFSTPSDHPIAQMLRAGLNVTINSDDPVFFDASLLDNYLIAHAAGLTLEELKVCASNSLQASFNRSD